MATIAVLTVGVLSVLTLPSTVYAGGGVGSGGGGGGGGGGHQSSYGWGWGVYATSGPGPTSGFRNGTTWASVQSTCNQANARSVYAFIVNDINNNGMIYDYHTSWSGPPPFPGHFLTGISVDHGRATTIATSDADTAFQSLPSKGVDTSGFDFGVNVAWFCYDIQSKGNVDSQTCTDLHGWFVNPSNPNQSNIRMDIYFDGPAGSGAPGKSIYTDVYRADVNTAFSPPLTGNHGFSTNPETLFASMTDGSTHKLYMYGIYGSNPLLWTVTIGPCGSSSNPPPPVACPMVPGANAAAVPASFGAGNNGETTYSPNGGEKHIPPPGFPQPGDSVTTRTASAYHVVSAQDTNTGGPLNVDSTNNTVDFTPSVTAYPYDANSAIVTYNDTYTGSTTTYIKDSNGNVVPGPTTSFGPGTSGNFTDGSASLGECYPIHFNVDTATANNSSLNNYENPSAASLTSTVTVHLWGSQGGSKLTALSVNGLGDSVSYVIRHVDGSTYPLGTSTSVSTSCGGGSNINCEATATPSTSVSARVGSALGQLRPGDIVCAIFTISPQRGDTDSSGTIQNGQPGTTPPSGQITSNSTCSNPVVNEPYFKVFGGDISAGDSFEQVNGGIKLGCVSSAAAASANVYGWNTAGGSAYAPNPYTGDASDAYAGAGAQFSLVAINDINGVASSQNNTNAASAPSNTQGNGLSFANSGTNPAGGVFATGFGAAPSCIPDFYADKPGTTPNLSGSIPSSADKSYSLSGSTIAGGTIGVGKHVVVYATGNVNITRNITFAGGPYNSISGIPSFVLVVKGNINISNTVTQLDGIYIAQPTNPATPTDGTLSDCLEASADRTNLWSACGNPLTVNGSFIANKVYLLRTGTADSGSYNENASIRAAHPGESNSTSATVTQDAVMSSNCTSGTPDANGFCGNATYHPGGTSYGPWSGWSADTRGCGATSGSPRTNTSTTQYNNQYVSGLCASGYRWQSRSVFTSSGYYSCPAGETVSGSKCKATPSWRCPDGSLAPPSRKCIVNVTPSHASEVFNYNPAFWLTLSLQNVSSQNALKYDSITSLPPVL